MFDSLYVADNRDRTIFGAGYCGPQCFEHGKWETVLRVPAVKDSDGQSVEIDEMRLPARCWRVRVLEGKNSYGILRPAWLLGTGSGDDMGRLCVMIAKAISEGMLGLES